jgi:hypothetical protein
MFFFETLRISILDWFEYVTKPRLNTFEEPEIEVIALESKPPVQDSAIDNVNFFFINLLTIFLLSFFINLST